MNSKYLTDILACEGIHLPNISFKITELTNLIKILKYDIKEILENDSFEFNNLLEKNHWLKSKADELFKEITSIQEEIEGEIKVELAGCAEEFKNLSISLIEVDFFLTVLDQLLDINSKLKKARKKMEAQEFYECSKLVTEAQELVKTNKEKLKQIDLFKALSQEVTLIYEQLMYLISELWSQCVIVEVTHKPHVNTTSITVSIKVEFSEKITQLLKASSVLKTNKIEKSFGNVLLNSILNEIIMKKTKIEVLLDDVAVIQIEVDEIGKKPNYLQVFNNIKAVTDFLKKHLNFQLDDSIFFLCKVGSHISNELAERLILNCLSETIPTNSEDLEQYQAVVSDAKVLEQSLQDIGFLPENSTSVLDFAKNINVLFANKFCQTFLEKARIIIKKDLHNLVKSEEIVCDINILPAIQRNLLREKMNAHNEIFSFPLCQISKAAEEFLSLIQSMINEMLKSTDLCAVRLFYTMRNIFEMYCAVAPLHHKKFLESLPHLVAIFHNNCLYFAYFIINFASKYYIKVPSILQDHFTIFLEQAVVLRSLAVETLEANVTNQRNQIIFILRDSGLTSLNENPKLDPNVEKSIRQCVRHLQILQKVWIDVLPEPIYNRVIAFLLDAIVDELISLIICVEDISSQTSSDLESCFNIIVVKGPSLFRDWKEIHRHARKWQKFKEFVLVLKGTLRDIDDRWADGIGPLANEFTPDQVKHLIRALFQNSEKRAMLLSKIR